MTKTIVTDKEVRGFKPYLNAVGNLVRRLAVGGGLHFEVTAAGHRHFIHRFQGQGKGAEQPPRLPDRANRLGRNFTTQAPNRVWLADLTYIPTGEGWLYLATVLDLFTRKIGGWCMRPTLHVEIALDALPRPSAERPNPAHFLGGRITCSSEAAALLARFYSRRWDRTGRATRSRAAGQS